MSSIGPLDGAGRVGAPPAAEPEAALPAVDERVDEDRSRFQRALERRGDDEERKAKEEAGGEGPQKVKAKDERDEDRREPRDTPPGAGADEAAARAAEMRSAGERILFSLGVEPAAEPQPTPQGPPEVNALADQLCERILVGNRVDGTQELRLTLKAGALGGAEVRIARAEGGVQVQVVGTDAALEVLEKHGARLAQELAGRLTTKVVVEVLPVGGEQGLGKGDDEQGQQQRRSRGLDALFAWQAG